MYHTEALDGDKSKKNVEEIALLDVNGNESDDNDDRECAKKHTKERNAVRRTLYVSYCAIFLAFVNFSMVLSSLWPYLQKIDSNVTESFMGWVNGTFCVCQFFACLLFGYWKDKRKASEPLYLSSILLFAGNLFYMFGKSFGTNGIYVILISRAIQGLSTGCVPVVRSVAAELSSEEDRAKVMALVAFYQGLGVSIGPVLQAIVKPIGEDGVSIPGIHLQINIYTLPCLFLLVFSILMIILQYFFFDDNVVSKATKSINNLEHLPSGRVDMKAIFLVIFVWFVVMTMFTIMDTIISPITLNEFAWSKTTSVFYVSIMLGLLGVIAIACFLVIIPLSKKLEDRIIVLIGCIIMLIGLILFLPWGPDDHILTPKDPRNMTDTVGCPYRYDWCHDTPSISLAQFVVGLVVSTVGYAFAMVSTKILYSKIIGPFPQGKFMGWFSAIASLARTVTPIYIAFMYEYHGLRWSSIGLQVILLFNMLLMGCYWKRFVPYVSKN